MKGFVSPVWLACAISMASLASLAALEYPGPNPGPAKARFNRDEIGVRNRAFSASWSVVEGLRWREVRDLRTKGTLTFQGELCEIVLDDGSRYPSSSWKPEGKPQVAGLVPDRQAASLAQRSSGQKVESHFRTSDGRFHVLWRVTMLDQANYLRQEIEITPAENCVIREVCWFSENVPGARTAGQVDGSPMVAGHWFFGLEDPHALNKVDSSSSRVTCRVRRDAPLRQGETLKQSFVWGISPPDQMRRAFLYYLEHERAHPYRTFLHYNSWYDIAWQPFALNETNCLEAIRLWGDRFIRPHGVTVDSLVFDDGWDNPQSLWKVHRGFPRGLAPLADACASYNTRLGIWLSPFGGYGEPKAQRLKFGREQGYEINDTGFSLAGPKYYAAFKSACVGMIRDQSVNYFKFDGIATGMYANGGAQYILDTEAMRRLMLELRREDPSLFINLTTGSWPSPFWLRFADSLWRQGEDMGFTGPGSKQQQWLTYRDQEVYRNIVGKGPLYPLNSLMSQGVAYSRHGTAGEPTFNSAGFKDDVHAFFGSGTGLQELYLQPDKLTQEDWRVLAEAAKWSRANADVLLDTHWIGGDPSQRQAYGYASWSPRKGILSLRNPSDQPQDFTLLLHQALEVPSRSVKRYALRSVWGTKDRFPKSVDAFQPYTIRLQPFEILVLEAIPLR
jgi:hypothetical protein